MTTDLRDNAARRSRRYVIIIAGLHAVSVAVILSRSWFHSDDFQNFSLAREMELTSAYLFLGIFGHFAPGHRALDWLVSHYWPLQWVVPTVLVGGMLFVTAWATHKTVRILAPSQSWPTLLVAGFAFSPLIMESAVWWASAAHTIPALMFTSLATLSALRYFCSPTWVAAAGYGLSLGAAIMFYEKTALAPVGILALLWAFQSQTARQVLLVVARRCSVLIALSVFIVGAYGLVAVIGPYYDPLPRPSGRTWLAWFVRLLTAGPFAGAFGVKAEVYDSYVRYALLSCAGVLTALIIGLSLSRSSTAWRAWAFLAVAFVPGVALTAYGRAEIFGPIIASHLRYSSEFAYLVILAVTLAYSCPSRASAIRTRSFNSSPLWLRASVAGVVAGVVAISVISSLRIAARFPGDGARSFIENAKHSAEEIGASRNNRWAVLNTDVPERIVPAAFAPYNQVSKVLELIPETRGLSFVAEEEKELLLLLPDGTLTPAQLASIAEFRPNGGDCLGPSELHVPITSERGMEPVVFARVDAKPSGSATTITIQSGSRTVTEAVDGGRGRQAVRLWPLPGPATELTVAVRPSPGHCVRAVSLAVPQQVAWAGSRRIG